MPHERPISKPCLLPLNYNHPNFMKVPDAYGTTRLLHCRMNDLVPSQEAPSKPVMSRTDSTSMNYWSETTKPNRDSRRASSPFWRSWRHPIKYLEGEFFIHHYHPLVGSNRSIREAVSGGFRHVSGSPLFWVKIVRAGSTERSETHREHGEEWREELFRVCHDEGTGIAD